MHYLTDSEYFIASHFVEEERKKRLKGIEREEKFSISSSSSMVLEGKKSRMNARSFQGCRFGILCL